MRHPPPPTRFASPTVGQRKSSAAPPERPGLAPPPTRFGPQATVQAKPAAIPLRLQASGSGAVLQRMETTKPKLHSGNWGKALDVNSAYFAELLALQLGFIQKEVEQWKQSNAKRANIARQWTAAYLKVRQCFDEDHGGAETKEAYRTLVICGLRPFAEPPKGLEEAKRVWADMQGQYARWDGTLRKRGAWWGSPGPGDTSGAKSVSSDAIDVLKGLISSSWRFQNSFSGVLSFHRKTQGMDDFIYHMAPP
ncbi:hypothetical protein [Azospirillum sp.]|uniref:hypothetical protein n=1 Tax=Azospirillum sp. TaxID=34012 RepID=UPI002605BB61|nr:hypothetical protein [Azospirillum sp.]